MKSRIEQESRDVKTDSKQIDTVEEKSGPLLKENSMRDIQLSKTNANFEVKSYTFENPRVSENSANRAIRKHSVMQAWTSKSYAAPDLNSALSCLESRNEQENRDVKTESKHTDTVEVNIGPLRKKESKRDSQLSSLEVESSKFEDNAVNTVDLYKHLPLKDVHENKAHNTLSPDVIVIRQFTAVTLLQILFATLGRINPQMNH